MLTALTFILILSVLILIHEFGHFIVAKKCGMKVEEFGFGLPPRLIGFKKGETTYSLNLLPFGGFVKIFGEDPTDTQKKLSASLLKRAFNNKPWYLRFSVILAGPIMNFSLAVIVIAYLFTRGTYVSTPNVRIVEVEKASPAHLAGLKKDDLILSLYFQKEYPITSPENLTAVVKTLAGKKITIKVKRDNQLLKYSLVPRRKPPKNQGALGVAISNLEFKRYPWYQAPFVGLKESLKISFLYYQELFKIIGQLGTGHKPSVEVTGPVGIARLTNEAVQNGLTSVIQLLGLLSLNLGLINIFPFPALDGGQLVFVLVEGISRRKFDERLKGKINAVGFAILIGLIILVTVQDLIKLFK